MPYLGHLDPHVDQRGARGRWPSRGPSGRGVVLRVQPGMEIRSTFREVELLDGHVVAPLQRLDQATEVAFVLRVLTAGLPVRHAFPEEAGKHVLGASAWAQRLYRNTKSKRNCQSIVIDCNVHSVLNGQHLIPEPVVVARPVVAVVGPAPAPYLLMRRWLLVYVAPTRPEGANTYTYCMIFVHTSRYTTFPIR